MTWWNRRFIRRRRAEIRRAEVAYQRILRDLEKVKAFQVRLLKLEIDRRVAEWSDDGFMKELREKEGTTCTPDVSAVERACPVGDAGCRFVPDDNWFRTEFHRAEHGFETFDPSEQEWFEAGVKAAIARAARVRPSIRRPRFLGRVLPLLRD
jgi:hypothetical protein